MTLTISAPITNGLEELPKWLYSVGKKLVDQAERAKSGNPVISEVVAREGSVEVDSDSTTDACSSLALTQRSFMLVECDFDFGKFGFSLRSRVADL